MLISKSFLHVKIYFWTWSLQASTHFVNLFFADRGNRGNISKLSEIIFCSHPVRHWEQKRRITIPSKQQSRRNRAGKMGARVCPDRLGCPRPQPPLPRFQNRDGGGKTATAKTVEGLQWMEMLRANRQPRVPRRTETTGGLQIYVVIYRCYSQIRCFNWNQDMYLVFLH